MQKSRNKFIICASDSVSAGIYVFLNKKKPPPGTSSFPPRRKIILLLQNR